MEKILVLSKRKENKKKSWKFKKVKLTSNDLNQNIKNAFIDFPRSNKFACKLSTVESNENCSILIKFRFLCGDARNKL